MHSVCHSVFPLLMCGVGVSVCVCVWRGGGGRVRLRKELMNALVC